jgi:hypothetical protein
MFQHRICLEGVAADLVKLAFDSLLSIFILTARSDNT